MVFYSLKRKLIAVGNRIQKLTDQVYNRISKTLLYPESTSHSNSASPKTPDVSMVRGDHSPLKTKMDQLKLNCLPSEFRQKIVSRLFLDMCYQSSIPHRTEKLCLIYTLFSWGMWDFGVRHPFPEEQQIKLPDQLPDHVWLLGLSGFKTFNFSGWLSQNGLENNRLTALLLNDLEGALNADILKKLFVSCPHLNWIALNRTHAVSLDVLKEMAKRFPTLLRLDIEQCLDLKRWDKKMGDGLVQFVCASFPKIESLNVACLNLTPAVTSNLTQLRDLKSLDLSGNLALGPTDVLTVIRQCPKLETLVLFGMDEVISKIFPNPAQFLFKNMPKDRTITIRFNQSELSFSK